MDTEPGGFPSSQMIKRASSPQDPLVFMVKKEVKRFLEAGRQSFNEGRIDQAIEHYRKALEADESCALVHFNLAYAYHEEGRYEHARDCYSKAIDLEPTCSLFLEHLARLNFETLDYQESIKLFNRASLVGPIQPLSLGLWGRALYESSLYEEAISAFENLLEREEQTIIQVGARFWLVVCHLKLDRIARARKVAEQILAAPEVDQKVLLDLGEHFLRVRCLGLARTTFQRLAAEHEELTIARLRLEDIRNLERKINDLLPSLFEGDEERILHQLAALRHFGSDKISRALLSLLGSTSPLIREAVLEYHITYGYHVVDSAKPFLRDPASFVRLKAVEFFDRLDDPAHIDLLTPRLEDERPEIRKAAAGYVARHGTMEQLPQLEMALAGPNPDDVRTAMREAVFKIKRRHHEHVDAMANMTVATEPEESTEPNSIWRSRLVRAAEIGVVLYLIYKILAPLIF